MPIDQNYLLNSNEDAQFLTCITCNYYAILKFLRAANVSAALAQNFYFEFRSNDLLDLSYSFEKHSNEENISNWTGFASEVFHAQDVGDFLDCVEGKLQRDNPVLCFGNGFNMAWTPFYQKEDVEHSFIITCYDRIEGRVQIVDCYVNNTKYGKAVPVTCWIEVTLLDDILRNVPGHTDYKLLYFVNGVKPGNIDQDAIAVIFKRTRDEYLAAVDQNIGLNRLINTLASRDGSKELITQLSLLFWLGLRSREYYLRWLGKVYIDFPNLPLHGIIQQVEANILPKWKKLNEITFILSKRSERGIVSLEAVIELMKSVYIDETRFVQYLELQ